MNGAWAVLVFSVAVFSGEGIALRYASKLGLAMGHVAAAQCFVAALVQFLLGARLSRVDLRWWPAIVSTVGSGIFFYLSIRTAPAAIVGLIEPLALIPIIFSHRVILKRSISVGTAVSVLLLLLCSFITVSKWPERVSAVGMCIFLLGVIFSGLAVITSEKVPAREVPSFVLVMQITLMLLSAAVGYSIQGTAIGGGQGSAVSALAVGGLVGLFIGLGVAAFYYAVSRLGSMTTGVVRLLRLPLMSLLAYALLKEEASLTSAIGLVGVAIFSVTAVVFDEAHR